MKQRFSSELTTIATASIAIGGVVLALKLGAWWLTGSVALYADALESLVNVAAAVAVLVAIRYSARPADTNHPFGHHKAEYFSVVFEGVLITVAAISIFSAAWNGYLNPRPLEEPGVGLMINGVAAVINAVWGFVLLRRGRVLHSPALAADGWHLLADVVSSAVVLLGLLLVLATGWLILDPLLATLMALNILWVGWRLIRKSIGGLMDEAAPPELLRRIRRIISDNAEGAIEAHDVRTRQAGQRTFIEFHLVVAGDFTVVQAHEICDRLEEALQREVLDADVTIHVEPEGMAKHTGVVVV